MEESPGGKNTEGVAHTTMMAVPCAGMMAAPRVNFAFFVQNQEKRLTCLA
jgi:hypothetical protein